MFQTLSDGLALYHREDDGGPGRSAALYSHFWMLRRVQRGYACFDAYARISLAVSAQQLVLVESYFALGHFMLKSEGLPGPRWSRKGLKRSKPTCEVGGCYLAPGRFVGPAFSNLKVKREKERERERER